MENKDKPNNDLEELRNKIIKTGLFGIFIFALSVIGSVITFYIGKTPEYAYLRILILLVSSGLFLIGLVILYFFKDLIETYKLINNYDEDKDEG